MFSTVHGGIGEDGTLQSLLESEGVPHTGYCSQHFSPKEFSCLGTRLFILLLFSNKGPGAAASKTCMDKVATSLALSHVCNKITCRDHLMKTQAMFNLSFLHHIFFNIALVVISSNEQLADLGVLTINKDVRRKEDLLNMPALEIWDELISKLQCETLCVKPARDGCSTGVARLWLVHTPCYCQLLIISLI